MSFMYFFRKLRRVLVVGTCGVLVIYGIILVYNTVHITVKFGRDENNPTVPRVPAQLPVGVFFRGLDTLQTAESASYRNSSECEDVDCRNKRFTGDRGTRSNIVDDGVPKVIIVAYYRGGSSLTGSLFKWNSKVIYYFEPLHFLYESAMGRGLPLVSHNGRKILPPSRGHELPYVYQILGGILSCDFDTMDVDTLVAGMSTMSGPQLRQYRDCHIKSLYSDTQYRRQVCLKELQRLCLKSSIRVVKEIRLPMESTHELLRRFPSLKIIHVLRDVRGLICSRASGTCRTPRRRMLHICSKTDLDITWRMRLEKEFPGRLKMLRYEELAENPIPTAESLYEFLQMTLPISVGKSLYNSTMMGHEFGGKLGVVRADSIATAYKWRGRIDWNTAKNIQKYCKRSLEYGQYPLYFKEEKLRRAALPLRKVQSSYDKYWP